MDWRKSVNGVEDVRWCVGGGSWSAFALHGDGLQAVGSELGGKQPDRRLGGAGSDGSSLVADRALAEEALLVPSPDFEGLHSKTGRPSIVQEKPLRVLLPQAFYNIRSER